MGLEIYKINENKRRLFVVSDEMYDILEGTIVEKFEKITGVFIDNYGKSRLSYQHSKTFLELINDELREENIKATEELKNLIAFLNQIIRDEIDVDLIGD